jgi:adenine deaminase
MTNILMIFCEGHINQLVKRSLDLGYDLFDVLHAACLHPVQHYKLDVGTLQVGDPADMILVNNPDDFKIQTTWIRGEQVFENNHVHLPEVEIPVINQFEIDPIKKEDLLLKIKDGPAKVIVAINGALITQSIEENLVGSEFESDLGRDILKIVVVNRYGKAPCC